MGKLTIYSVVRKLFANKSAGLSIFFAMLNIDLENFNDIK
ncbi:hypothetical protein DSUL_140005 [Desulfovibrionales bacterium]